MMNVVACRNCVLLSINSGEVVSRSCRMPVIDEKVCYPCGAAAFLAGLIPLLSITWWE